MEQLFQIKLTHANRLQNNVAVITGGKSSIGLATAKEFIAEKAKRFLAAEMKP